MTSPRASPKANGRTSWIDSAAQLLDRWSERISFELFRFGILVTMPALVVLVTTDVTLRYVFNAPLQWARDVNGLLLLITIFCALPHAWDRSYHIRMEVFYSRFSPLTKGRADVLASLGGVLFFGAMAFQAARFVPFMMQTGETGEDLEFPLWPFMAILAFCALVVAVRIFSNPTASEERLRHPSVSPPIVPAGDERLTTIGDPREGDVGGAGSGADETRPHDAANGEEGRA